MIVFPDNWEEILEKEVLEEPLRAITVEELMAELIKQLKKCLEVFGNNKFCLALSGGVDSSTLAILLKTYLQANFYALTIGTNARHPDIIFAQQITNKLRLNHDTYILSGDRESDDIYDDLFKAIARFGYRYSIHADCIDEMQGGYWLHRKNADQKIFDDYWERLIPEHLDPMRKYAHEYGVFIGMPYLAAHNLLRRVKMSQRTANRQGKIILRQLAKKIGVPDEIINRKKLGLCNVWDKF